MLSSLIIFSYQSFEYAKVMDIWRSLVFLFLTCQHIYSVNAISSSSSSQFDLNAFLDLPRSEYMLTYPTNSQVQDNTEASSQHRILNTQPQASQDANTDLIDKRKYDRKLKNANYRKRVRENPAKSKEFKERKKKSLERSLSKFTEEELKKYKIEKREKERIQYHVRKQRRGYGTLQNERLKRIRVKIKENTATKEDILEHERVVQQKRDSRRARDLRKEQSKRNE